MDRLIELFEQAIALPTAGQRRALLDALGVEDPELAAELGSLVDTYLESPTNLESLAEQVLPGMLRDLSRDLGAASRLPRSIGRYRLREKLGSGGMGEVWRAVDLVLNRPVALKFVYAGADPDARTRLLHEARAISTLDHPGIAVVHEVGVVPSVEDHAGGERLFIAMACYQGDTVGAKLARGALDVAEAVDIAAQVADALRRHTPRASFTATSNLPT
jgi:hypothetical protein